MLLFVPYMHDEPFYIMSAPLKHVKALLSCHRGRDGLVLAMGFCTA